MTQAQSLDVLNLLEQLEESVLDGTRVPLSGRILVRENDLLDLLDDVRAGLPAAIQQAQQILERQAQILADAQQQAQAIVAQAQQERALLIDQNSIRLQAERDASSSAKPFNRNVMPFGNRRSRKQHKCGARPNSSSSKSARKPTVFASRPKPKSSSCAAKLNSSYLSSAKGFWSNVRSCGGVLTAMLTKFCGTWSSD
uniref:ORF3 n=1 Tax=Synechococcus elongatus (strain ATCC 33912 / PCC 7942 / FACHB-805) TaxID=1140 RepID=Q55236_SYNE7|nr:ORF3 [Synechococcus elongatus PCC 7942 = FACHB-805]